MQMCADFAYTTYVVMSFALLDPQEVSKLCSNRTSDQKFNTGNTRHDDERR